MDSRADAMLACMAQGDPVYLPSRFWQHYNEKNREQLDADGFENLKRTVATNYFTWVIGREHEQYQTLKRNTRLWEWPAILRGAGRPAGDVALPAEQLRQLRVFTRMLWRFAQRRDSGKLLERLAEPTVGNPFPIHLDGRLISQDLANALLEYEAVREHFRPAPGTRPTICELGAGYGRNAFLFSQAIPGARYVIVDIPPALYVAERYLSEVFPEKKVLRWSCFESFSEIAEEYEAADFVFVLPHQAELLPPKSVDLFVNISSLHEMTMPQIEAYFALIDRLTAGYFYTKQWFVSENPQDGIRVKHTDYPVRQHWRELYLRKTPVQPSFFEAMYAVPREVPAARPVRAAAAGR
jgi:putative sugar O-methyltransferase